MAQRSVAEERYRDMLDELDAHDLFANYSNARLLEEVDPIAYRVGLDDYLGTESCEKCGHEGIEESGLCADCEAEDDEDEDA